MPVKVLMTWDISPEREQEYFEFVIGEFVPGAQRIGLQPTEAWATMYGNHPQIQVCLIAEDAVAARRALNSTEWLRISDQLMTFVKNYSHKVIPARGGFQF